MDKVGLKVALEAALAVEIERVGPNQFKVEPIVHLFEGRGVHKATLYRWAARYRDSGVPGVRLAEKVKAAVIERATRVHDPARDAASEIVSKLPTVIRVDDIASRGGTIAVVQQLHDCLELAQKIIKQSMYDDGRVRLTKTALAASEHIRRCLETSVRMAEAMREISRIDEFHAVVVEEIAKESPDLAERLLMRLHHMTAAWNGA
jgi:hypothetical protein